LNIGGIILAVSVVVLTEMAADGNVAFANFDSNEMARTVRREKNARHSTGSLEHTVTG